MKTIKIIISIIFAFGIVSSSIANPKFKNKKHTRPTKASYENTVKEDLKGPSFKNTASHELSVEEINNINTDNANNLKGPKFKNSK